MFEYQNQLLVYGGWNQMTSYNNMLAYKFDKKEWVGGDISVEDVYRWNHCGLEVEAVPSWKYFVFAGSSGQFDETKPRQRRLMK
jgi:dynein heavy chain